MSERRVGGKEELGLSFAPCLVAVRSGKGRAEADGGRAAAAAGSSSKGVDLRRFAPSCVELCVEGWG